MSASCCSLRIRFDSAGFNQYGSPPVMCGTPELTRWSSDSFVSGLVSFVENTRIFLSAFKKYETIVTRISVPRLLQIL